MLSFQNMISLIKNGYVFEYDGGLVVSIYDEFSFCIGNDEETIVDPASENISSGESIFSTDRIGNIFNKKELSITSIETLAKALKVINGCASSDSICPCICIDEGSTILTGDVIEEMVFDGKFDSLTFFDLTPIKKKDYQRLIETLGKNE